MHPSGTRFATAGSDHKVKIWNLLPVADARQELQKDTPRLLATLSDHFSPVNIARFSHNGRFLASGSDDKLVSATLWDMPLDCSQSCSCDCRTACFEAFDAHPL